MTAILGLGDYQYICGDPSDYAVSYNLTWGRLDSLVRPIPGNHEYQTGSDGLGSTCPSTNATAQNYFSHFGAAAHAESAGHFSFDIGTWHFVGLNANCGKSGVGGCSSTSSQTSWLRQDLGSTTQPCVAAFWHQPLFTAYKDGNGTAYRTWWNLLYAAHADVVLNGHVHNYQRYAPRTPTGALDQTSGITEYIVGTGGEDLFSRTTSLQPQPQVFLKSFGYLRMTLEARGWTAEFIDSQGNVLDTSSGSCHG